MRHLANTIGQTPLHEHVVQHVVQHVVLHVRVWRTRHGHVVQLVVQHVVQHSVTGPERDRIHGVRGSASQIWGVQDTLQ